MAQRRHHRRSSSKRRSSKNILNKTLEKSVAVAKSTSRKYMPKVKSGIEGVGSKVINTSKQSVPYLQSMTRKFLNMFSSKTKKHRRH
jgi:hypothetical protein